MDVVECIKSQNELIKKMKGELKLSERATERAISIASERQKTVDELAQIIFNMKNGIEC